MQPLKAIHICNSHQPTHKPKIAKEYVFANADKQGRKISTCGNSTYPKVAVQWLNQALCIYQSLCLVDNEVLRNRHLRVAAKR